jgi:hypothetical protein
MSGPDQLHADLGAAIRGAGTALDAADQLCLACVDLLAVDGAAISLTHEGSTRGTFGSSGELSRHRDELAVHLRRGSMPGRRRAGRPGPGPGPAEAAAVDSDGSGQGSDGWSQLASLERTEVYQATGMGRPGPGEPRAMQA